LTAELKAAKVRISALEAQFASLTAVPRTVGIAGGPQLVRPYMRARMRAAEFGKTVDDRGTAEYPPAPAELQPDRLVEDENPPLGSDLINTRRLANTPRTFLPLPAVTHVLPAEPPPQPTIPRIPRPRVVGRAPVPPGSRASPAGWDLAPTIVWSGLSTVPRSHLRTSPRPASDDRVTATRQLRRRARAQARQLGSGMRDAWADWADLPVERLPVDAQGFAQLPLLLAAVVLAVFIAAAPILLA
jgi:hypothetical protein